MAINLHLNVGPTCNTDECVKSVEMLFTYFIISARFIGFVWVCGVSKITLLLCLSFSFSSSIFTAQHRIKDYNEIWKDLRSCSHVWRRILVPGQCVFDLGVSEAIYSSILQTAIHEKPSPVIFMRAQKNPTEQKAMQRAHIIDGAAMCEALSLLERRVWPIHLFNTSFSSLFDLSHLI